MADFSLYPPLEPLSSGWLDVGEGHEIYWEQCGHPEGNPILVLHGGPGAGCLPIHRRYFDPARYRIILFDQRGCGRSRPYANVTANGLPHLIADIESLRQHLRLKKWALFGGSWGSTLALAYAQEYPQCVTAMILRGIFLMRQSEIDWFIHGMGQFYPEAHATFLNLLPPEEQGDVLEAYYARLMDTDPAIHLPAARAWARYEESCAHFSPDHPGGFVPDSDSAALSLARLEAHYFLYEKLTPDDRLLRNAVKLASIPGDIIQGRYDVICPPATATALHQAWPGSRLHLVENGAHAASDPALARALVAATDRLARQMSEQYRT